MMNVANSVTESDMAKIDDHIEPTKPTKGLKKARRNTSKTKNESSRKESTDKKGSRKTQRAKVHEPQDVVDITDDDVSISSSEESDDGVSTDDFLKAIEKVKERDEKVRRTRSRSPGALSGRRSRSPGALSGRRGRSPGALSGRRDRSLGKYLAGTSPRRDRSKSPGGSRGTSPGKYRGKSPGKYNRARGTSPGKYYPRVAEEIVRRQRSESTHRVLLLEPQSTHSVTSGDARSATGTRSRSKDRFMGLGNKTYHGSQGSVGTVSNHARSTSIRTSSRQLPGSKEQSLPGLERQSSKSRGAEGLIHSTPEEPKRAKQLDRTLGRTRSAEGLIQTTFEDSQRAKQRSRNDRQKTKSKSIPQSASVAKAKEGTSQLATKAKPGLEKRKSKSMIESSSSVRENTKTVKGKDGMQQTVIKSKPASLQRERSSTTVISLNPKSQETEKEKGTKEMRTKTKTWQKTTKAPTMPPPIKKKALDCSCIMNFPDDVW